MRNVFSSANLPRYHDALLIVRVEEAAVAESRRLGVRAAAGGAATGSELESALPETSGFSLLAALERGGLVKRVVPVARPQPGSPREAAPPRRAVSALAMAASAPERHGSGRNAGVCIIELERSQDVAGLNDALAHDPNVQFVSRVPVRYLLAQRRRIANKPRPLRRRRATTKPPSPFSLWNLRKIEWGAARALPGFKDANDVRVGVLDTGIDDEHPDLGGVIDSYVHAHPDTPSISGMKDIVGHGTHVSGTISALINNDVGINGICRCRLHAWKIFNDETVLASPRQGFIYVVDPVMYLRALADCLDQQIDVVNLSIGGPGEPDAQEQRLFDDLIANGTTVVAAMGNEREDGSPTSYPAAMPGVIAVGATTLNDTVAAFSNRGGHISLCAPGKAIWSTLPTYQGQFGFEAVPGPGGRLVEGKAMRRETDYDAWDGTSMASPHVAAAAALAVVRHGRVAPDQMRRHLMSTADQVPGMRQADFHPDYGAGRLNLLRLLR